ncbi:unnamed protein product [Ceratitis capitata]|uniref:(Mediterranean fruit fly) hypothetical protein n=1 Tax=Ceratitis capitata TaxID=7213 RepID=A0A811V397_CERCA|nr:unnamed protein product [Ceratitis capitata]
MNLPTRCLHTFTHSELSGPVFDVCLPLKSLFQASVLAWLPSSVICKNMLILKLHKMLTNSITLLLLTALLLCLQQCTINAYRHKAANYELLDNDSRFILYQDLMSTSKRFIDPNTTYYSQMLFDVARNQVIVGARTPSSK